MSLPRLAIRRPVAVSMLFVAVVMLGVLSILRLPIDLLPDVAYPKLVVYTSYPDVAPAEVERFVTERVEQQVAAVPGVERVESVSREGASLVTLRFAWGTDMDFAALGVREKLDALRADDGSGLPDGADRPLVLRTDPTAEPIIALSVAAAVDTGGAAAAGAPRRGADLAALKDLAESVVKRRLEQVDGIAQAAVVGGPEREIRVEVDAQALDSYGVTIEQVSAALDAANQNAPGGTIRRGRFRYALRTLGEFQRVDEIGETVVARDDGSGRRTVFLRDVAAVVDGARERETITRHDGRETIGLLLFKEAGANTVRTTAEVERVLDQLRAQYPAIAIAVASSQAGFIAASIDNLVQDVALGGTLAFLVLFVFLRDVRVPVAIALAIPISLVATFALFDAAGVSINVMSLGGLALAVGLLMDNSIVVVENVVRHRELGLDASEAAAAGTEEVQRAIAASTLTTIAVFGPIVYVEGVAGELFASLSLAVAFGLGASVLVAITLLPMLAARWTGARPPTGPARRSALTRAHDRFDAGFGAFTARYERVLAWSLAHRAAVLLTAGVLLGVTALVTLRLPRSVLPDVDQGSFRVVLTLPRGTPLDRTSDAATRVEAILRRTAGVDAVFTRVGRQAAVAGVDDVSGLHTAVLDVRLTDGTTTRTVLDAVRAEFAAFGGALAVETGQATQLGRLLDAGEADLAVRIRADDLDAALAYARQAEEALRPDPALASVRLGTELGHPEVRVTVDRERAAAFGVDPGEVARTVERYMRGETATEYVDFDRKVPIVVRLPDTDRRSLDVLREVRVPAAGGGSIPVRELIRVQEGVGPTEIRRIDQARVVAVYADARTDDLEDAVAAIRRTLADLPTPDGVRADVGGENEEMRRAFSALALAMGLAVLLVYMILAAEFESLLLPFVVLLAVPLATLGASIALWVAGHGLNVVSLIGMVVLIGIVDNDAVVKIDFINGMRARGHSVRDSVLGAGRARLRPIVINTITAMLGLLPMALGLGAGAQLQAPMAVAVLGGLFSATALTLVVIPVAYSVVEELRERVAARRGVPAPALEPAVGD